MSRAFLPTGVLALAFALLSGCQSQSSASGAPNAEIALDLTLDKTP